MGKLFLVSTLLVTGCITSVNAQIQQVTSVSGAYFAGSRVSVSFTIGEPVTKTMKLTKTENLVSHLIQLSGKEI